MAKVHVLWANNNGGYSNTSKILQAFSDGAAAEAAKTVIDACEPKFTTYITEVEFIGTVAPPLQLPKDDPYKRVFGIDAFPRNALMNDPLVPQRPPDSPKHPLVELAEKIHDEAEA